MKNITLDLWTIENLCFPEGYNISSTSQHSLCKEELNVDNLARLKRSAVEHLHIMRNQGLFAMDSFELVDNTIKEYWTVENPCFLDGHKKELNSSILQSNYLKREHLDIIIDFINRLLKT